MLVMKRWLFEMVLIVTVLISCAGAPGLDVSGEVEVLGSPFASKPLYARNVWDMQSFQGRLYLGHGNSSNLQPSPNAGPIPVVYWDPAASAFVSPYTVNEE